ncbi:MAG: GIY-YIG nuclease family protein [Salinimicrobium sediminis]|nr:GIY-YIG nuclease family protein [Salinimicrobium sediminis]
MKPPFRWLFWLYRLGREACPERSRGEPKRRSKIKAPHFMWGFLFLLMKHEVYILYSKTLNRYYIGSSSDIRVRMQFHATSPGYKFTGKAGDWEIFLKFFCENKKQVLAIEKHIKSMKSKKYIENLKKYPEMIEKLKNRYSDC